MHGERRRARLAARAVTGARAVAGAATRRVELGGGRGVGTMAIVAIVAAAIIGPFGALASFEPTTPWRSLAIAVGPLVLVLAILLPVRLLGPGRAVVDLTGRTLQTRRRTVPFHDIHRIAMYRVPRGGDWLVLHDGSGRAIGRFAVTWSVRREMGAAQWRAMHELLWYSSARGLERVLSASPRRAPLRGSLDRQGSLALIAAQIAWLEQGGGPDSVRAPMRRFVGGL